MWKLWRRAKSVSSLRSRYRFYVKFLRWENLVEIKRFLEKSAIAFNNYIPVLGTKNAKEWHSIQVSEKTFQLKKAGGSGSKRSALKTTKVVEVIETTTKPTMVEVEPSSEPSKVDFEAKNGAESVLGMPD